MAFGRLIEPMEPRISILGRRLPAWRNDANYFTGRHPVYVVTGFDMVLVRDFLGYSDLVLGCDFSHVRFPLSPYFSKD